MIQSVLTCAALGAWPVTAESTACRVTVLQQRAQRRRNPDNTSLHTRIQIFPAIFEALALIHILKTSRAWDMISRMRSQTVIGHDKYEDAYASLLLRFMCNYALLIIVTDWTETVELMITCNSILMLNIQTIWQPNLWQRKRRR